MLVFALSSDTIRRLRWAAASALAGALCTAGEHAPDVGASWWLVLLVAGFGVAAGRLHAVAVHRWSLVLVGALGLSTLFIDPATALWGMALVVPMAWVAAGFIFNIAPPGDLAGPVGYAAVPNARGVCVNKQVVWAALAEARRAKGLPDQVLVEGAPLSSLGLDSLDLATVVAQLDDTLGIDPFAEGEARFETVGQFLGLYER